MMNDSATIFFEFTRRRKVFILCLTVNPKTFQGDGRLLKVLLQEVPHIYTAHSSHLARCACDIAEAFSRPGESSFYLELPDAESIVVIVHPMLQVTTSRVTMGE